MTTFEELYARLAKAAVQNRLPEELGRVRREEFDHHQLD